MGTDFQSLLPFLTALQRKTGASQDDDDYDPQNGALAETQVGTQAGTPAVQAKGVGTPTGAGSTQSDSQNPQTPSPARVGTSTTWPSDIGYTFRQQSSAKNAEGDTTVFYTTVITHKATVRNPDGSTSQVDIPIAEIPGHYSFDKNNRQI